jgi:hypothetical protein
VSNFRLLIFLLPLAYSLVGIPLAYIQRQDSELIILSRFKCVTLNSSRCRKKEFLHVVGCSDCLIIINEQSNASPPFPKDGLNLSGRAFDCRYNSIMLERFKLERFKALGRSPLQDYYPHKHRNALGIL